jgi:thioredoxin
MDNTVHELREPARTTDIDTIGWRDDRARHRARCNTGGIVTGDDKEHTMSHTTNLTDETFDEAIADAATPILVDFWAVWCGPCRAVAPILESLAQELDGQVRIAKVDVDAHPGLAQRYQVRSIPTMILFRDGAPVERLVGVLGRHQLLDTLTPHLS